MYSIRISSITATESAEGDGSSPKAYIRGFTIVKGGGEGRGGEGTVFLEEVLFTGVSTGHVQ
jgi:hypothetical protein